MNIYMEWSRFEIASIEMVLQRLESNHLTTDVKYYLQVFVFMLGLMVAYHSLPSWKFCELEE